jgi:hypothetical protein
MLHGLCVFEIRSTCLGVYVEFPRQLPAERHASKREEQDRLVVEECHYGSKRLDPV